MIQILIVALSCLGYKDKNTVTKQFNLIKETITYLAQIKPFLAAISSAEYVKPIEQMSNSTIGHHTRHLLECYQCLLNQWQTGYICYDNRPRNLEVQENPAVALQLLVEIIENLRSIDTDQVIELNTTLNNETNLKSSVNRELLHNYEHTTHHLALIRIGLTLLNSEVQISNKLGTAKSTLIHRNA